MKKCPKCGAELTDDVRYCPYCGAPVGFTESINNDAEEPKADKAEEAEEAAPEVNDEAEEPKTEESKAEEKKNDFEEKAREAADEVKEAAAKLGAAAKEGWDKLNDKYGDKAREAGDKAKEGFEKVMDTPDTTDECEPEDIEANKVLAILAYIGILVIIPLLAGKDSKFARFHTNQGLILFIFAIIISFLSFKLSWMGWVFKVLDAFVVVFAVLGIINAASGKAKELPLIGKLRILN